MGIATVGWNSTRKVTTLFWIVFVCITAIQSLAYYHQWQRERENSRQEKAQRDLSNVQTLLQKVGEAEAAERGYIISGDDRYRAEFADAAASVRGTLHAFGNRPPGAVLQEDIPSLLQIADEEIRELQETMDIRKSRGFAAAAAEVSTGRAERFMDALRPAIENLESRQLALLAKRTAAEQTVVRKNTRTFIAVTVAEFVLLGLGYWGINRYAAHRRQTEKALGEAWKNAEMARAAAEAANRAKDRVLHTVSHDLRTPLNGMVLWAEILRRGDPRNAEAAEAIKRYADAQTRLVNDLLDASRMERGALSVEMQKAELGPILRAAVDALRPTAEEKGVRLECAIDLPPGLPLRADAFRLQQVFWNLISNAIKFTPPERRVEVRAFLAGADFTVEVRDAGSGISPAFLPRVFEAFAQDESDGARHQGLGLGLAIVKHLVELHGGKVEAQSDGPGRGATFTVRLPMAAAEPVPAAAQNVCC